MKLNVTKEQFLEMYNSMTNEELREKLGINNTRLYDIIKTLGLKKPRGPKRKYYNYEFEE